MRKKMESKAPSADTVASRVIEVMGLEKAARLVDGVPAGVKKAKLMYPSVNDGFLLDVELEIGRRDFERQMEEAGYSHGERKDLEEELPPIYLVKKMLGRDAANKYREALTDLEDREIRYIIKEPFPLVNKTRLRILIGIAEDASRH